MMDELEPKIRPLVESLNKTSLVRTFSSCEGHFGPDEQTIVDRNRAEVRFVPADNVTPTDVEKLLTYVLTQFKIRHGLLPVHLLAYKLYTPIGDDVVEETFVLELRPFNRFDPPERKRSDIDRAIEQTVKLVTLYQGAE